MMVDGFHSHKRLILMFILLARVLALVVCFIRRTYGIRVVHIVQQNVLLTGFGTHRPTKCFTYRFLLENATKIYDTI